jgi:hypothetical protein
MKPRPNSNNIEFNYQTLSLTSKFNRVEERFYLLKLRYDLFSSRSGHEHLFSSLPTRLEKIRQLLGTGQADWNMERGNVEEITAMLKDLEADLKLRELLQAQRSIINYLSGQEEVYASLSQRWKQLTNAMISIDTLVFSNPPLATKKREELEKDLKELEECLQSSAPQSASRVMPPSNRLVSLAQAS